ncbi:hypothetical protein CC86DRAFT_364988 [Ophiobolus disseminans]|uniref:Uncharacterized protein n=1 Tax=Ophiobolus disseminans TaxID=1469910 RepID=A0A6A7AI61_9PLEO|nr:hypothetical protein CC86DRAFT_364988 [Ophiobolus disseminans]
MRTYLAPLLLAPLALAAPDVLAPFEVALPQLPTPQDNSTLVEAGSNLELLKRQGNVCTTNYYACAALNAPGLCCPRTAICTADQRGAVACCPQGAQCTGALGQPLATPGTGSPTFVLATTTTNNPFVQQTNAPGPRSTVPNAFFPFFYIPTTYTNAAACSSAYSTCQNDAASCTTALANGAQGVTVSAPNGGATITAVPSVGLQSAQQICASLSAQACSGLQVEACAAFGGQAGAAPKTRCGGGYLMGAGVAVGVVGGMLR